MAKPKFWDGSSGSFVNTPPTYVFVLKCFGTALFILANCLKVEFVISKWEWNCEFTMHEERGSHIEGL